MGRFKNIRRLMNAVWELFNKECDQHWGVLSSYVRPQVKERNPQRHLDAVSSEIGEMGTEELDNDTILTRRSQVLASSRPSVIARQNIGLATGTNPR